MIVIRTDHDEGTHYMYVACDSLISYAQKKGFKVISIEGDDISLDNVRKRVKKSEPGFIFFNGHGSDSGICNNSKTEFINISHSDIFNGTVTYTRACNCLTKLGRKAVEKGCNAFIGYTKNFWIPKLSGFMSRPMKDPVARPVIETSNIIAKCLIAGRNVHEAVEESRQLSKKHIVDLIYSTDPYRSASLPALVNNLFALNYEGDSKATLR